MTLLLDQNLSPRLVPALADLFPGSAHVRDVGLAAASDDDEVWRYAAEFRALMGVAIDDSTPQP